MQGQHATPESLQQLLRVGFHRDQIAATESRIFSLVDSLRSWTKSSTLPLHRSILQPSQSPHRSSLPSNIRWPHLLGLCPKASIPWSERYPGDSECIVRRRQRRWIHCDRYHYTFTYCRWQAFYVNNCHFHHFDYNHYHNGNLHFHHNDHASHSRCH